jgi:hypothetical protein
VSKSPWKTKVKATCIEKIGKCHHEVGESYIFESPISYVPQLCAGIQEPSRLWITHCACSTPSWEADDPNIYRIHCISKKGTVWKLERIEEEV